MEKGISETAIRQRSIKGLCHYIRYFVEDDTDYDIKRLAPNHVIQSTASGIFKKALLNYNKTSTNGKILVPMHDAILVEVDDTTYEQEKLTLQRAMIDAFHEVCPDINCRVHFTNFYD